jgi:hypothetical protein
MTCPIPDSPSLPGNRPTRRCEYLILRDQRGVNTKRPTIVFFWISGTLAQLMIRQARTADTVLVKSREMSGGNQTLQ